MILQHQTIDYLGLPLFSWISLRTPNKGPVPLPAEACVAFITEGDGHQLFVQESISARSGQVIVSACGRTVGQMIAEQEEGQVSTIVAHLQQAQLREIYRESKPQLWQELERPVTRYIVQTSASQLLVRYFEGINHLFAYQAAVSEELLALKIRELILLLLRTESAEEVRILARSLFSERVFSFREIVEAHICSPICLEMLASLTNRSLSAFKREFKRVYQQPPATYIMDRRLEKVAEHLLTSDESITNIGDECGFRSIAHLSRAFKAKYGQSPSQYRLAVSVN